MANYPKPLIRAIGQTERAGGRLLFVDEDKGACSATYTAFLDMAGIMAIITVDMVEGLPPTVEKIFLPVSVIDKARAMMEGGQES